MIADFDFLKEGKPLRPTFELLGGSWESIKNECRAIKSAIEDKKPELTGEQVRDRIQNRLANLPAGHLPKSVKQDIEKILRESSPWEYAKSAGINVIPNGDPTSSCRKVLNECRSVGLFIVESGELEGFVRTVGGHGPAWVNAVLEKNLSNDPELRAARTFVDEVNKFSPSDENGIA